MPSISFRRMRLRARVASLVRLRRRPLAGALILAVLCPLPAQADTVPVPTTHVVTNGRIAAGVNQFWGSAFVEFRYQGGPNWVDNGGDSNHPPDAGRQFQIDVQNAPENNSGCFPGCGTPCEWGWNAVQAGNACVQRSGSEVVFFDPTNPVRFESVTYPLQWNTYYVPQRTKLRLRQELTFPAGYNDQVLQIDYTFTNEESFPIATRDSGLPVVYLTPALDKSFIYKGANPWTGASADEVVLPLPAYGAHGVSRQFQVMGGTTERWLAWISHVDQIGLGLYAPSDSVPAQASNQYFSFERINPANSSQSNIMQNFLVAPLATGATMNTRVYLIAGTLQEIREHVYILSGHPPIVRVSPASVNEGNGGTTTTLRFPVALDFPWFKPVTIAYETQAGTATPGTDYIPVSGTLTFPAGETEREVAVTINTDSLNEAGETLSLRLSSPSGHLEIGGSGWATGVILNDDPLPGLSIAAASQTEGTGTSVTLDLNATLSTASGQTLTATYSTSNGSAVAPADYQASAGTLVFEAGQLSKTISVPLVPDALDEFDETFTVTLADYGMITSASADGTILDDDAPPTASIGDLLTIAEGQSGTSNALFPVTLSAPSGKTITVGYRTARGTATAPSDYITTDGTLTFPPGDFSESAAVPIVGDPNVEELETFAVSLYNPVNLSTGGDPQAIGAIPNDDVAGLAAGDATVTEGDDPVVPVDVTVPVTMSGTHYLPVTVDYHTIVGSAFSGDFVHTSGTLTFAPGETGKSVTTGVKGDLTDEDPETFSVMLTNRTPNDITTNIDDAFGVITIQDNDPPPNIVMTGASVTEGSCGTAQVSATVSIVPPSGKTITWLYETVNGTAVAGEDYNPASQQMTLQPGVVSLPLGAQVISDRIDEPDEQFVARLSNVTNALVTNAQATLTIVDDDTAPGLVANELAAGSDQVRTLPVSGPPDVFAIAERARSSYEVVVEGVSGPIATAGSPVRLELMSCELTNAQASVAIGGGDSRSLRWENTGPEPQDRIDRLVRVSAACTSGCAGFAGGTYRIRAFDTTYSISRFNNTGTQKTTVTLQNPATYAISATLHFWSAAGTLLQSSAYTLPAHGSLVLDSSTLTAVAGQSGSITISNNGRYGDLIGKAVGVDVDADLTFETVMETRPR